MKFIHSSSSSSSTAGCLPAVLRRLLKIHTLPTLPFDNNTNDSFESSEFEEVFCDDMNKGSPGIVAKLMGLDSMPQRILSDHNGKSSIKRSRSMGSVDNSRKPKLVQAKKLSLSEIPSFLELENDEFIIFSFEGGGKDKELEMKLKKTHKGLAEFKDDNQEICGLKNGGDKNSSKVLRSTAVCDKNLGVLEVAKQSNVMQLCERECGKRMKKKDRENLIPIGKVETEYDSENSSPVSVLDFVEFSGHQDSPNQGKEDSRSNGSNSKRKLRGDIENCKHSSSPSNSSDKRCIGSKKNAFRIHNFGEFWGDICRMAEREMYKERWRSEDYEKVGVDLELEIFDQLILELVDQSISL